MAKGTVLVVDDDTTFATLLGEVLRSDGWRPLIANRYTEAVQALSEHPRVDVTLCDLELGAGDSGLDLIEDLRRLKPGLPAILVTGHGEEVLRRVPVGDGLLVLFKPFETSRLLDMLAEVMRAGDG